MVTMTKLAQGQVANPVAAVFTNPLDQATNMKLIMLHNTNATEELVKIYRVPAGGAADATTIMFELAIAAKDTRMIELPAQGWMFEAENDALYMESTTTAVVNVTIDGSKQ